MPTLNKFTLQNKAEISHYYQEQGYVVVSDLLSQSKIDRFLAIYEQLKYSPYFVFNTQDTHLPSQPKLTAEGLLKNSMLNPSQLKFFPKFTRAIEECLYDSRISEVLEAISGAQEHNMWQNMFFDRSTGTIEHQDHYYLDTNPAGQLVAAWYALEDIQIDSGCFFVLPKSHKGEVIERGSVSDFDDHDNYRTQMQALIERSNYEKVDCTLKKGDVLFWHPYTIHGANANTNPALSRKSFTCHFYPSHLTRQFTEQQIATVTSQVNPNIRQTKSSPAADYWQNTKMYLRWGLNQVTDKNAQMIMRREVYDA